MKDRRSVDDLSIEELEQILRLRKREARLARLNRLSRQGRRLTDVPAPGDMPVDTEPDDAASVSYESFVYSKRVSGRFKRNRRDRVLLAIEILAAISLVAVLFFAVKNLRDINREAVAAQSEQLANLPTPSPTPLFSTVVLPGGHTPPTENNEARPNYEEVPAHLRPLVEQQFAGPVVVPTPRPGNPTRIRIPAINVDAPIVLGDSWEQLKKGVGHHLGTANPGDNGNVVLSAHNDIYGEIFRYLDRLSEGDEIYIETQQQVHTYRVLYWHVVEPTDVGVMDPTAQPVVTLISCYPYLVNTQRIVVVAERTQ